MFKNGFERLIGFNWEISIPNYKKLVDDMGMTGRFETNQKFLANSLTLRMKAEKRAFRITSYFTDWACVCGERVIIVTRVLVFVFLVFF